MAPGSPLRLKTGRRLVKHDTVIRMQFLAKSPPKNRLRCL